MHQKGTPEEPATMDNDLPVVTAFKKLKVDAEGGCVKKMENQSKAGLKHKPDSTTTEDKRDEAKDAEDWSRSLQNFCFCDEGAIRKRGRHKWKSMCRYHQLLMRKDRSSGRNSLNLAQAVRAHKPLLQESRLKLVKMENPSQVMRAARFDFVTKTVNLNKEEKSHSTSESDKTTATASVDISKSLILCEKASQESRVPSLYVFGAEASKHQLSFSSLLCGDDDDSAHEDGERPVCSFLCCCAGHGSCVNQSLGLWAQNNGSESSRSSVLAQTASSGAAAPAAVACRVDLAVERSCSQEARLDESEYNVNELAAYFDHYLHMPKEMSSMAKMMYA